MKRRKLGMSALFSAALLIVVSAHLGIAVPEEPDGLPPDIEALYNAGQYRQAAQALQAALKRNPDSPSLNYWLGRSLFEIRDFSKAISSFERAAKIEPQNSDFHDWLGRACGRKAEENSHSNMPAALPLARRAHHEFEVAVQLNASNVKAQRDLIAFTANAPGTLGGGEQHALEQIRALSAVDATEGMLALADLFAVQRKFDKASAQYEKVLASSPNRIDVYFEIADYYRDQGDSQAMKQAVESADRIGPSDSRLNYYRGVALVLAAGEPAAAEENLRTYISNVPENSELPSHASAYEWLGKLYENENKPDLAAEQYQAALALDPRDKAAREALKKLQKRQ
ncbi:MAG TPA: tetratricopeptide repeat protein [Terriglobales bacterium]|nr:tetratricopeptide repeat protein [Terriglobales bacterium]